MSTNRADAVDAEDLLDNVREAPTLEAAEKETIFWFSKPDDTATVDTTESGLTRRLLAHSAVEVKRVTVLREDGGLADVPVADVNGRDVVGLRGELPVGALKVLHSVREDTGHAEIVTDRVYRTGEGE